MTHDYTKQVQKFIEEDPSCLPVLLNIAAQLYRENGLTEFQFKSLTFIKGKCILFTDAMYDKYKKQTGFTEPMMNAQQRAKVKQRYAFGNVQKYTAGTFASYVKRVTKKGLTEFILTPKYDGIGLRIYFGQLCLTRYDKKYGLDVTYKCKHILSRQQIPRDVILRGELITRKEHEGFVDRRSYVSAMVSNQLPLPEDVEFICYEYLQQDSKGQLISMSCQTMLQKIKELFKFEHLTKKVNVSELTVEVIEEFADRISPEFNTDGVVVRPNDPEFCFEDRDRPQYQVAYKFEAEQYIGRVSHIQWSLRQKGYLQPLIILKEPVVIEERNIAQATGVNFNFLFHQNIVPGKKCLVSARTIPRIEGDESNKKTIEEYSDLIRPKVCPGCGGPVQIDPDSVYRFKCKNFLNKCYQFILLTKAVTILKIEKVGEVEIDNLFRSEGFRFDEWLREQDYTQQELFMILADGVSEKSIEKKFDDAELKRLIKFYKLIL